MLVALWFLRTGFVGRSRTWWNVAFWIQFWHHIEHALLQGQAITGENLFGRPVPMSVLQLWFPRVELHLFYNTIVFIPMALAMYFHMFPPPRRGGPRSGMQLCLDAAGCEEVLMGFATRTFTAAWLSCLALACSVATDDTQGVQVSLEFEPAPHVGVVQCTVTLADPRGAPIQCTEVELEGNMNHAGMVPVFSTASPEGEGTFVAPLEFTMGGDWLIFVRGKTEEGRAFEVVSEVPGVRPKVIAPDGDAR